MKFLQRVLSYFGLKHHEIAEIKKKICKFETWIIQNGQMYAKRGQKKKQIQDSHDDGGMQMNM